MDLRPSCEMNKAGDFQKTTMNQGRKIKLSLFQLSSLPRDDNSTSYTFQLLTDSYPLLYFSLSQQMCRHLPPACWGVCQAERKSPSLQGSLLTLSSSDPVVHLLFE